MVQVHAGAGGTGVGEHGGDLAQADGVTDVVGDLVGVDGGIWSRSRMGRTVMWQWWVVRNSAQLCGEDGSDAGVVGADDTGAGGEGLVGQVDVEHDPGSGSPQALPGEQVGENGWVEAES